ncbi:phenylalanine--tRNA ligase subunit alpha [Erysipelotrichaceae bacterium OttesenSCG-928-M19]|nr:phenylalanine--tRNA ligase subunit alpha [Erysipelotrichaceae bacterium OttesenSCG-928-M19]
MLDKLKLEIIDKVNDVNNLEELKQVKVETLGKKGAITQLTKTMKDKSEEEKKTFGKQLHELKEYTNIILDQKEKFLLKQKIKADIEAEKIDIFLPGYEFAAGLYHPLTLVTKEIEDFFSSLGYSINEGNEVEEDKYNFEMLNIPKDHPARDMQDTFYFNAEELLRTHTSPVQVRTMENNDDKTTPVRMICPGKVYRRDEDDATHSHQFMQVEGLVVDKNISLADLKGTLELFAKKMFGDNTKVRFRPSYFPFTEPSVEVDLTCHICKGKGCSVCKNTGWIEILGAGQVHPNVIEAAGYDPNIYQGFAFGLGIERVAMLKYGIDDIRHLYNNNLGFLNQFNKVK